MCYNIARRDELSETDLWLGIIGTNSKSVIDNNNISKISLNGEVQKSESLSIVTSTNNRSCYIFATNFNGNAYGNVSGVRVYGAKISLNNEIVHDYIPVLDLYDYPCLFDKVEKKCYYNQGTGEFLYG